MLSRSLPRLFNITTCVCTRSFFFCCTLRNNFRLLPTKNTVQRNILGNNIRSSSSGLSNVNDDVLSSSPVYNKLESYTLDQENVHNILIEVPDDNGVHLYIAELLEISPYNAKRMVANFNEFCDISEDEIGQRVDFLESKNVDIQRIRKMPWLLLLDSRDLEEWTEKIGEMLKLDFICAISFLKVPRLDWLNKVANLWNSEQEVEEEFKSGQYINRLEYIADKLQCQKWQVADMMVIETSLQEQPFHRVKYVLHLLLDAGMDPEEIITAPMLFKQNIPLIKRRIGLVRLNQINNITSWMIRTTDKSFYMHIEDKKRQRKLVTKYPDVSKFLEDCLNCNQEEIQKIIYNEPSFRHTEISKIQSMFNNLIDKGFKIIDIKRVPKILCQDEETLQCRYDELVTTVGVRSKDVGNFTYSFIKNDSDWSNFITRYTANINNEKKNMMITNKIESEL